MTITTETIKKLVNILGFVPIDGEADVFHKKYIQHNGYTLRVNFANKVIEYADTSFEDEARITIGSRTTSNFAKQENFVVLECVDRLLEKGYSPGVIEIEKVYPSGRQLDILVNDTGGQAFLMIECKTWGKEYIKEVEKMIANGGQLFTYFKNATSAKSLCLYTSRLSRNEIEYENSIIDVSEDWKSLSETKDVYERWNKVFKKDGIFQKNASPYNIVHKRLTYGDLVIMKDEDSRKIFHQIMTILRHNGVSDKPNAFNKLLNLFVCKIIDEDRSEDEELQFQCWDGLADEKLQMTLNDLYKEGMLQFLKIKVIDHSESDVDNVLQSLGINDNAHKQRLMEMFSDARLKKSPNFAFIEVQDEKTFQLNAKIVREVIELLQQYKFRYEQKHEFLGDFFEKMLNTSMKQEAGQFFTPVPITRFIISSLPVRNFVQKKIDEKDPDVLPTVIDYACGSGHFLTEYMSAMQDIIESLDVTKVSQRTTRNDLNSWRGDVKFKWAKEYVYGIDFDNRLVKTAKVSAFFNGDGEATIIWGDGLDSFEHSEVYRDKLKETMSNKQDNGQFDILISNPPYSVEAFRRMLKYGADSFDLYSGLTDSSSEIECLFIERMKQLLKVGGWAGIILPSSMLSNGGIYSRTRDILFKYFSVKAIVELGSGTFMETGTNTVILFLERRPDSDYEKITQAINAFFTNKRDVTVSKIEQAFSAYVANVYDDLSYEDYLSFVNENPNNMMKAHELWLDYEKEYGNGTYLSLIRHEEKKIDEFLIDYLKNHKDAKKLKPADFTSAKMKVGKFFVDYKEFSVQGLDRVVSEFIKHEYDDIEFADYVSFIKRSPSNKMISHSLYLDYISRVCKQCFETEKEKMLYFLLTYNQNIVVAKSGQKQDEKAFLGYEFSKRRGYEGIKYLPIDTMLFDVDGDLMNPQKVNSHILNTFLGNAPLPIGDVIANHISYGRMSGFIEYGTSKFTKRINLKKKDVRIIGTNLYPQIKLGDGLIELFDSLRKPITRSDRKNGEYPYYGATGIIDYVSDYIFDGKYVLIGEDGAKWGADEPSAFIVEGRCWVNNHAHVVRANSNVLDDAYLMHVLNKMDLIPYITGEVNVPKLNQQNLLSITIPVPPIDVQKQIVADVDSAEQEVKENERFIVNAQQSINFKFLEMFGEITDATGHSLGNICELKAGKFISATEIKDSYDDSLYPCYGGNGLRGYVAKYSHDGKFPLVGRQGALCGNVHLADGKFYATEHAVVVSPKIELNIVWLYIALQQSNLNALASGAAQPGLTVGKLNNVKIKLPSIELQDDFADFFEKTYAAIVNHKKALDKSLKKRDRALLDYL